MRCHVGICRGQRWQLFINPHFRFFFTHFGKLPGKLKLVSELVHRGANTDTPWSENLYCTAQPCPQHPMAAPSLTFLP